jgi:hypothetical protein
MILEAVKFDLFFNSWHLFVLFFTLFTFENERSAAGFSKCKVENRELAF